jgi:DNA-directed RNA polymerase subunit M/transcription elongation factor TFIIS
MHTITNPESFRVNICKKIAILMNIENDITISGNIERGIFNFVIEEAIQKKIIKKWDNRIFVQLYIDRLRSVYMNLKNPLLVERIVSGEIKSQNVAFMSHQEFNPEFWCKLIEQKVKRDASKFNNNVEASTDVYICSRCKSRKCTYESVQIRSADESTTIFVNCLSCGKNWTC